jgi:hypothetical protein
MASTLVSSYKSFVASNITWLESLKEALGKKKFLPDTEVEKLAEAHAEAYSEKYSCEIFYQQTSSKAWVFYSDISCKREFRHDTATKYWQRNVEQYHNITKKKATVSSQVDKVAKKAKALKEEFSASEIKALIALLQTK